MPGGDRTGPLGAGSMTGRGAGYCAGNGAPGYGNRLGGFFGRSFGFGGGGRGWRHWFHATGLPGRRRSGGGGAWAGSGYAPSDENEELRGHAQALESELKAIRQRLDELESKPE
ncbi:DUF5320 domain-containing protein [bacterium]|nr:DUF5320 domain-containing protein [bacterium]